MADFVVQIFNVLSNIISAFASLLVDLFESIVAIFYTAPSGTETTGSLTVVGTLMLIALGTGLVIWAFNFIRKLIRVRKKD